MHRRFEERIARELIVTASEETCPTCGRALWVTQHRPRYVEQLDGVLRWVRADKRCPDRECPGRAKIFRPLDDLRIALPKKNFGLDVVRFVGERHLGADRSLSAIGRELNDRGIPIDQTHVGELFRDFVALTKLARGDDEAERDRLRRQGGIVLMADGVQFDERSPVLYLAWDALSSTPLFGDWRPFKSKDDLVSLLRRVEAMKVPVIAVVTDKETGLVPAVAEVFPKAPQQYCQFHFLENCARPLDDDLGALAASVADRAEKIRKIAKRLHEAGVDPEVNPPADDAPLSDEQLVANLGLAVKVNAHVSGKQPLEQPALVRHGKLETIRQTVDLLREGGPRIHRKTNHTSP
jgi:hypothetical protein